MVGTPLGSLQAGGIVVSLVTFFAALYLLHRLTELELGPDAAGPAASRGRLRPRSRPVARDALVVIAVPVGLLAFMAYVHLATRYGALAPFRAQDAWHREFRGPLAGLWGGLEEGAWAARHVLGGHSLTDPVSGVRSGLLIWGPWCWPWPGSSAAFGGCHRLYGVYGLASLLFAVSFPLDADALKSLPRFLLVFFSVFMWLGAVTAGWRYRSAALAASAAGLAGLAALFGSGYWID